MISRRTFLISGASVAVVSGLGLAAYVQGPGTAVAREPWKMASAGFGDSRLDALAYAILAPNPHNRQPWMFELVGTDEINIYCDLERRLDHTDPLDRQITIGFGCMLELLAIAAREKGYQTTITTFPDGEPQPRLDQRRIAYVKFQEQSGLTPDALTGEVLQRRSLKEPFASDQLVSEATLSDLLAGPYANVSVGGTVETDRVAALRDLAWDGWMIEYETPLTRRESIDLMRIGNREVAKNPDGIDLGGFSMGLMKMVGIMGRETLDTPGSQAFNIGIDMYHEIVHSAQGFAWVKTAGNRRADQIAAGRAWVRMNLKAQSMGLGVHPLSQVLQEFPEMAEPYARVHQMLTDGKSETVQMFARLGYAKFPDASPRWPLEAKLVAKEA